MLVAFGAPLCRHRVPQCPWDRTHSRIATLFVVPTPAAEAFPMEAFAFGGNSHASLTRTALKGIT